MAVAKQIAAHLLKIGAVKLQAEHPFTWSSGWKSPIYCDNRIVLSHPEVRVAIQESFVALAKEFGQIDGIAGVATAGIAHGALLADRLGLPFIYVRSKAKAHGRQNQIEGEMMSNGRYLMVEDLISTGGSVLAAAQAVQQAGGQVAGVLAIFTYEFPHAAQAFASAQIAYKTLSNYSALLELAHQEGIVPDHLLATLQQWRSDPANWKQA